MNVNDYVMVKLTEHGRELYRKRVQKMLDQYPRLVLPTTPKEDAEGWSKWQLWSLMQEFGEHIYLGGPVPFEPEIKVESKEKP